MVRHSFALRHKSKQSSSVSLRVLSMSAYSMPLPGYLRKVSSRSRCAHAEEKSTTVF